MIVHLFIYVLLKRMMILLLIIFPRKCKKIFGPITCIVNIRSTVTSHPGEMIQIGKGGRWGGRGVGGRREGNR